MAMRELFRGSVSPLPLAAGRSSVAAKEKNFFGQIESMITGVLAQFSGFDKDKNNVLDKNECPAPPPGADANNDGNLTPTEIITHTYNNFISVLEGARPGHGEKHELKKSESGGQSEKPTSASMLERDDLAPWDYWSWTFGCGGLAPHQGWPVDYLYPTSQLLTGEFQNVFSGSPPENLGKSRLNHPPHMNEFYAD
ncbi:unnamed protein product [Amoebophrya sp. A120]|nr:unnamed protein product [Amoebophrya sp. A120]|eukprot:GSA120T00011458001.1